MNAVLQEATPYVYNPLERRTFEAIAHNAVGRASEINTYPSLQLTHSTGNSGWSVGAMQWDFGQAGRGAAAVTMLEGYQAWAPQAERKWENVGEPLSRIPWLQRMAADDPESPAQIVAMTSKIFNQNEKGAPDDPASHRVLVATQDALQTGLAQSDALLEQANRARVQEQQQLAQDRDQVQARSSVPTMSG